VTFLGKKLQSIAYNKGEGKDTKPMAHNPEMVTIRNWCHAVAMAFAACDVEHVLTVTSRAYGTVSMKDHHSLVPHGIHLRVICHLLKKGGEDGKRERLQASHVATVLDFLPFCPLSNGQ
jgi:hypothetical protein